jgi:RNA polymerase primary sigma factor
MRELKLDHSITNRDTESLNKYLAEIGKIPLLTISEEIDLTQRIRNGDEVALQYLIRTNLRFVVSVAKKYQNRGLSMGDLINEGNLGLIKAASRFDDTKGFKFISFAVWWIRQSIMHAIAEQTRVVRLPMNLINSISKVNRTASDLEQLLERRPSLEEISEEIALGTNKVAEYMDDARKCRSLDAVVNEEIGSTLLDLVVHDAGEEYMSGGMLDLHELHDLTSVLSRRERQVLFLYYGLQGLPKMSLDEIAAKYQLSKERIRQIKDKGIRKLRAKLRKA